MGKTLEYQNIICTEITIIGLVSIHQSEKSQAIKELVLRGYITPHCNKSGFYYSISKKGVAFFESLNDKYAEDFTEIVKKANVLFLDHSDRKLTYCINEYAVAMLRGEKS